MAQLGLGHVISFVLSGLLSFVIYRLYEFISERLLERELCHTHQCRPIPQYQHEDGLLRRALGKKQAEAYAAGRAAPFAQDLFKKYGNTWLEPSWKRTTVHTCDPKNIQAVTSTSFANFGLKPLREGLSDPFIGKGILMVDGAEWAHARNLIRPTFARTQISDFDAFEKHFRKALALIPGDGSTVDLQPIFKRLYLDTSTEFFLGESIQSLSPESSFNAEDFLTAFDTALKGVAKRNKKGRFGFLHFWGSDWKKACAKVHRFIDRYVEKALQEQKSNCPATDSEKPKSGQEYTKSKKEKVVLLHDMAKETSDKIELRNQILNVFFPARDSTAIALSNTMYLLARHPRVWNKLRADVLSLGDKPLTFENLKSLPYLRHTINEEEKKKAIRLHSPINLTFRMALRPTILPTGGCDGPLSSSSSSSHPILIPRGTVVCTHIYTLHRLPSIWSPDPETFRPERWSQTEKNPHRPTSGWEYIPFLGGPRICPAQNMVLGEIAYAVARMCREFVGVEERDGEEWREEYRMTAESRFGCKVGLRRA
ncbi:MAG: hypothetical protein Q9227_000861 [Pyrenula ochraceoflavens]